MAVETGDRPPYVRFETMAVEDRTKTQETGKYTERDEVYVHVTPQGSRDTIVKVASEWLEQSRHSVREGRLPPEWLKAYERAYESYKQGKGTPLDGTDIKNWAVLSPAQVNTALSLRLYTVEDLARANDDALQGFGPGAVNIRQKARDYLEANTDSRKAAQQLSDLRSRLDVLEKRNSQLEEQKALLETENTTLRANAGNAGARTMVPDGHSGDLVISGNDLDEPAVTNAKLLK